MPQKPASPPATLEFTISHLGGLGDGIAEHEGRPVFIPFTCPGDRVQVRITQEHKDFLRAEVTALLTPSPKRQTPPCHHFGTCGGCSLQHLNPKTYRQFKQDRLLQAIDGLSNTDTVICPLMETTAGTRRRVELRVGVQKGTVSLGFLPAGQIHGVVDITMCPLLGERLFDETQCLRTALQQLRKPSHLHTVQLTQVENGLDILFTLSKPLPEDDLQQLFTYAAARESVLRLSVRPIDACPTRLFQRSDVTLPLGNVTIQLPEGAFLQATTDGQQALTDFILRHSADSRVIADIYSGCGTYSFPLVKHGAAVHAYEGDAAMILAMQQAIHTHQLEPCLTATQRDLYRHPLPAQQLNAYDTIVINPPRNGALPQIKEIARSHAHRVVMLSCNPATFRRDAKCLYANGFQLKEAQAIDQFLWSPHLELAALFERNA
ncbi:MAG: class I SAM-dependent RNA methyltransferase [Hyphomicrobiales bacterium]|nr:class I SAM-dependent RNA methyltransferase [Hyphomicrobiales bacterium]